MNAKPMTREQAEYTDWGMMYGDRVSPQTVARKLTGTYDWNGMCGEVLAISGVANEVQKCVNELTPGWRVFERQCGDGSSKYNIGDYQQKTKRIAKVY